MKMIDATGSGTELSARLNRIPVMTRSHQSWLAICAALLLVDMADMYTFAFAAPAIRADWGLSVGVVGTITAASFLGMFIGSIVGGRLGDRIGRKPVIIGATALFSTSSLLSAFAVGAADLAGYRVLTGVGLQAMVAVVLAYVSEMFPRLHRGRAQTWIVAISLLGVPTMAWLSRWIVPTGPSAWRWVFVLGASGVLLLLVAARWLPESVRWLQANGQSARAEEIVGRIESEAKEITGTDLPPTVPQPIVVDGRPSDLIRGGYRKRTLVLCLVTALVLSGFYGFSAWVPTLLTEHGFTTTQSLTYTSVMSLAAVPGALLALLFIDRIERRTAIFLLCSTVGVLMLVFGFTGSAPVMVASGLLITLLFQAGTPCLYTYMPEIFPTNLRAVGVGVGNGIGRLAVFATSFLVAALLARWGFTAVLLCLAGVVVLAGLVLGTFGERSRGRSLEEIAMTGSKANGQQEPLTPPNTYRVS